MSVKFVYQISFAILHSWGMANGGICEQNLKIGLNKMNKKIGLLAAIAALSLGFIACDDDATDGSGNQNGACTVADNTCDGNIAKICMGTIIETDCAALGMICQNATCISETACTAADNKCDGNNTVVCNAGTLTLSPCGANQECTMVDGIPACQNKAADTPTTTCTEADNTCENGMFKSCTDGQMTSAPCGSKEECRAENGVYGCYDIIPSGIGDPCTCEGEGCLLELSPKAAVDLIPEDLLDPETTGGVDIKPIIDAMFKDMGNITAPNIYASANIKGCEHVKVPEGMVLGCLPEGAKITFPDGLAGIVGMIELIPPSESFPAYAVDAVKLVVSEVLTPGIEIKSTKGYCIAGALSLKGTIGGVDPSSIFDQISSGDYVSAKSASCPADSAMLQYGVVADVKDEFTGGLVICAKKCESNSDCREADGYSCNEIISAVPEDVTDLANAPKVNVCLDKANIDLINQKIEAFKAVIEASGEEEEAE